MKNHEIMACVCLKDDLSPMSYFGKFQDCFGYLDFPESLEPLVSSGFFFNYLNSLESSLFQSDKGDFKSLGVCDFLNPGAERSF